VAQAVGDGEIVVVNPWNGKLGGLQAYGNYVVLRLADDLEVWYCHLTDYIIAVGQKVHAGEALGRTGYTGNALTSNGQPAPHLHIHATHPSAPAVYVFGQRCVNIHELLPEPERVLQ